MTIDTAWDYIFGRKQYHGADWQGFLDQCWTVVMEGK